MLNLKNLLRLTLVSVLLSMKTDVEGSIKWCPTEATAIGTKVLPGTLAFLNRSSDVFPRNAMRSKNGETYDCPCHIMTCVQFCCPLGYAARANECVEDKFTFSAAREGYQISSNPNLHEFVDDPCILSTTKPGLQAHRYRLLRNVSIDPLSRSIIRRIHMEGYCMLRVENSLEHLIGTCVSPHHVGDVKLTHLLLKVHFFVAISICILLAVVSLIIYTVIPEFKNLRGWIVCGYLASYTSCLLVFAVVVAIRPYLDNLQAPTVGSMCLGYLGYYSGLACSIWLNVMSLHIWQTFKRIQSSGQVDVKNQEKKTFIRYSIYACVGPVFIIIIRKFNWHILDAAGVTIADDKAMLILAIMPVFVVGVCNACLYVATVLTIRKRKKETANLFDAVNKCNQEKNQWFKVYLKLYTIMGGTAIIWPLVWFTNSVAFPPLVLTVEVLQSILTFIVLVWRDEVRRYFRKRFNGMLNR